MLRGKRETFGFNYLRKGECIAVTSPAGPVKKNNLLKSAHLFERNGFRLNFLSSVYKKEDYLAGRDESRLKDIRMAFENNRYRAVLCTRGGYGSMRLLDALFGLEFKNPKPLFGFSDITALHIFFNRLGWITFHSPNLNNFSELSDKAQRFFFDTITGEIDFMSYAYRGKYSLFKGKTEGILTGGNLSIISSLSGTRFDIDLRNKILFLEDVNEEPYRVDRMLTQLLLRGDIKYIKGVVFGGFSNCGTTNRLKEILSDFAIKIRKPVIYGIDVGHITNNLILPFNIQYELDANNIYLRPLQRPFI